MNQPFAITLHLKRFDIRLEPEGDRVTVIQMDADRVPIGVSETTFEGLAKALQEARS